MDPPMIWHKYAYSTLVSPAPYFASGSLSKGRNKFHSDKDFAFV